MCWVQKTYNTELEEKMKQFAAAKKAEAEKKSSSGSTSKKSGGVFGSIVNAVKSVVPAVAPALDLLQVKQVQSVLKTIGGPVLSVAATALGHPELAALMTKLAPQLVDLGVAAGKEAVSSTSSSSSSKASSSTSTTSGAEGSGEDSQVAMMELQRAEEKQKEMWTLVSNILRSMHDTRMSVVNNLRA
jgi:hypothetical protein